MHVNGITNDFIGKIIPLCGLSDLCGAHGIIIGTFSSTLSIMRVTEYHRSFWPFAHSQGLSSKRDWDLHRKSTKGLEPETPDAIFKRCNVEINEQFAFAGLPPTPTATADRPTYAKRYGGRVGGTSSVSKDYQLEQCHTDRRKEVLADFHAELLR